MGFAKSAETTGANLRIIFQPQRQKTYLRKLAPSEDSDRPAHSRIPIRIRSESSLGAKVLHEDNEGSDQTARMRRRLRSDCADADVDADLSVGRTCQKVYFLTFCSY